MKENVWRQKSLTPVILNTTDDSYCTVIDLQNAIHNEEILNIAVTGPYGSGKSSVLRTFINNVEKNASVLDISLATLEADEAFEGGEIEASSKGSDSEQEKDQITSCNKKELLNRKIEYSILQQLVYRKTLQSLPYSRMRKIRHLDNNTIRCISLYIVCLIILVAFIFRLSLFQIPLLYKTFHIPEKFQDAISLISVILIIVLVYEVLKYLIKNYGGIRPGKISLGGNEIDIHDDGSIFNRYLDEILYFFQCTNYNVVVIEDLDRFNTTDIFLKLRELNHLINKSEMVGRKVKFIYAVKDDMFKDSSRSKFFDYITTVIPVITTSNSKGKLKQALLDLGHGGEISDEDIRDIAFYIDDMRLLCNIVNEYHQYSQRLNNVDHPLEARKILALMTIKNYHPHDFSELHNRKGKLYKALSREAKRKYVDFAIKSRIAKRDEIAKNKLSAYNDTCSRSVRELRISYILAIISKIQQVPINISIDNTLYKISDLAESDYLFDKLRNDNIFVYYYKYNNYLQKDSFRYNFTDIEKEVNHKFSYQERLVTIGTDRATLESDISSIEQEKKNISTYTIHELLEKFDIYEEDFFKEIGLSDLEEDFIRHGLLTEDYYDYISYFYPGIMSLDDYKLSRDIKLNRRTDYGVVIEDVNLLLQELPLFVFKYKSVWIYSILDYIAEHRVTWNDHYELIINSLRENDSVHFLSQYVESSKVAISVFADCMKGNGSFMWDKIGAARGPERESLIKSWLITCEISDMHESQKTWVSDNFDTIISIYDNLPKQKRDYFTRDCKYKRLSFSDSELLKDVVENGSYAINEHNVSIVVNVKDAREDVTKLSSVEEMQAALTCDCLSCSWHNALGYYNICSCEIDNILIQYIQDHIQSLMLDDSIHNEVYKDFLQSIYEQKTFTDSIYKSLCEIKDVSVDLTPAILDLGHNKLKMLIDANCLEYSIPILSSLCDISSSLGFSYIVHNRENLSEILLSYDINAELAEHLLTYGVFSQKEYQKIIASLKYPEIKMTQSLANKICALMSLSYSVCDEVILLDAIRLCTNKSHAIMTAVRKIVQSEYSVPLINDIIGILPDEYHDLMEPDRHMQFEDNSHNELLMKTLECAEYIYSYEKDDGKISVITKKQY